MTAPNLIDRVFEVSDSIDNNRTIEMILNHAYQEMGELSQEVAVVSYDTYKKPGPDGVVGEAIDAILCLLDIIRKEDPNLTKEDMLEIAETKLVKWAEEESKHQQSKM